MPDPIFAAEMAALAAARRERESGRIGDGMAAGSNDPLNPAGWMDFSGPRVPVPSTNVRWVPVSALESKRHVHDDDCLVPIAGGHRWTKRGDIEVPETGWSRCSFNGARYHQHADRLMAHQSGDRLACPAGIQP